VAHHPAPSFRRRHGPRHPRRGERLIAAIRIGIFHEHAKHSLKLLVAITIQISS
jgi:hypothetical protein